MKNAHSEKLNISSPNYKTTSLRAFYDEAENHIWALKSLGQDGNYIQLLIMLQ